MRRPFRDPHDAGQSLVEFALILPIFVLVLVGVFDFGRGVFAYNTVNNAAREGSRLAIVDQTEAHIVDLAVQRAGPVGIDASQVTVDYRDPSTPDMAGSCPGGPGDASSVGCLAVVRVTYEYNAATPILAQLIGTISIAGESRFRVESSCAEPADASCPIGD